MFPYLITKHTGKSVTAKSSLIPASAVKEIAVEQFLNSCLSLTWRPRCYALYNPEQVTFPFILI